MPVTPTYPGVYIEEIPSGVRTIVGVSTSVAAFVGYTRRGPINRGVQIFNFGDFQRNFGGMDVDSHVSYAVQQFFQNGGSQAWIVRVAKDARRARITLRSRVAGGANSNRVLNVEARSEGQWGNTLRLNVDYDTANTDSLFNLTVTEYVDRGGTLQADRSETFRNLSMNSFSSTYAVNTVNANSNLIRLERTAALGGLAVGRSTSGDLSGFDFARVNDDTHLNDDHRRLAVTINGDGPHEFDLFDVGGAIADLAALASRIRSGVRAISGDPEYQITCTEDGTRITATSGVGGERSSLAFSNAGIRNAADLLRLGILNGGRQVDAVATIRPTQTGTVGGVDLAAFNPATLPAAITVDVTATVDGVAAAPTRLDLWTAAADRPTTLEGLRTSLHSALSPSDMAELSGATVSLVDNRLRVVAGSFGPDVSLTFQNVTGTVADDIGLSAAGNAATNVARYALGTGGTFAAQTNAVPGFDGTPPDAAERRGVRANKTGLYALEDVDIFNILCIPNEQEPAVLSAALAYCNERRAFMLIDPRAGVDTVEEARTWLNDIANLRHKNAAAYFPRVNLPDPLQNFRERAFPPCGVVAGIFARTDGTRGVWKAPAGIEASMRGVTGVTYKLTDPQNGALNPLGLNCLRNFPVIGNVIWGARTLVGADQLASEWKYVPVRRLALFLEESLYRGTKWVVFEPNDEPLWAQIRLNVGAFMQRLFRQGAFQGRSPREAYFVKCDKETTTQNDINLGIVNIEVGFAPLKPAEFIILKIQQIPGDIQT